MSTFKYSICVAYITNFKYIFSFIVPNKISTFLESLGPAHLQEGDVIPQLQNVSWFQGEFEMAPRDVKVHHVVLPLFSEQCIVSSC